MSIVELQHGQIGYDDTVIFKDLNLKIEQGEFIALVGPNGSGKTTLLRALLGLHKLQHGVISIFGKSRHSKGEVGYVPQQAQLNLNVPLTGYELLELKGVKEVDGHTKNILGGDFHNLLSVPLHSLSIGQRQRIVIAFGLLNNPKLLCLDESTDGLDFRTQSELFSFLKAVQKKHGTTIIFISHDISAVGDHATRVICLDRAVLFDGDPKSPQFHSCLHNIYGKDSAIHHHHHH